MTGLSCLVYIVSSGSSSSVRSLRGSQQYIDVTEKATYRHSLQAPALALFTSPLPIGKSPDVGLLATCVY